MKKEFVVVDSGLDDANYQSLQENRLRTVTGGNKVKYHTQVAVTNSEPKVSAQHSVEYNISELEYEKGKQTAQSLNKQTGYWNSVDNCTEPVKRVMRAMGNETLASSGSLINTPTGTVIRAQAIRTMRTPVPKPCVIL